MANELLQLIQGITPQSKGPERGYIISDIVMNHLQELIRMRSILNSGDAVDGILASLFTSWHSNRAFESFIKDPSCCIFEEYAFEYFETTILEKAEAEKCRGFYYSSAVSPDGQYLHSRINPAVMKLDAQVPIVHVNLRKLPKDVADNLHKQLLEYYQRLYKAYTVSMVPAKDSCRDALFRDYTDKTEIELDRLAQILFYLKADSHPRKIYHGKVNCFLNDDPHGYWEAHVLVKQEGLLGGQQVSMANHRRVAQDLYPVSIGAKVQYFPNLNVDYLLDGTGERPQGTLLFPEGFNSLGLFR